MKSKIDYKNITSCSFFYFIDAKKVKKILPKETRVMKYFFNKALIALSFYENRISSIGPYQEAALSVKVKVKNRQGYFILNLPVSTREALIAGKKIWGFPKTLETINLELLKDKISVNIYDIAEKKILEISAKARFYYKLKSKSLTLISKKKNEIILSKLETVGETCLGRNYDYIFRIFSEKSEIGKNIKYLEIDKKKPAFFILSENKENTLS